MTIRKKRIFALILVSVIIFALISTSAQLMWPNFYKELPNQEFWAKAIISLTRGIVQGVFVIAICYPFWKFIDRYFDKLEFEQRMKSHLTKKEQKSD